MNASYQLKVYDTLPSDIANPIHILDLNFPSKIVTVEELINSRVRQEYYLSKEGKNAQTALIRLQEKQNILQSLEGSDTEFNDETQIEHHCKIAREAFKNNGFFILTNNKQLDQLNQDIVIDDKLELSFFRLAHLVGG